MKLFLTSSTVTKELVKPFEELIGKSIKGLKVAFIPDAAYGVKPEKDIGWVDEERQELIDWYDWQITDLVLKDIEKVKIEELSKFDVIYANGGFSGYLAKEMRRTEFDKALPELLEKGIIYVGSSAGSMVMSDVQDASSWYINEPEPEAIDILGLGYIDFQIYPHIKPGLPEQILEHVKPEFSYILLKDGQAVSVNDKIIKLHGEDIIYIPSKRLQSI